MKYNRESTLLSDRDLKILEFIEESERRNKEISARDICKKIKIDYSLFMNTHLKRLVPFILKEKQEGVRGNVSKYKLSPTGRELIKIFR